MPTDLSASLANLGSGSPQSRIVAAAATASAVTLLVTHLVLILCRRIDLHLWRCGGQSPVMLDRQTMNGQVDAQPCLSNRKSLRRRQSYLARWTFIMHHFPFKGIPSHITGNRDDVDHIRPIS